jgi:WD40 repeat protein
MRKSACALALFAAAGLGLAARSSARAGGPGARLVGKHKDVACLALSPDGKTAATGSWDNSIKLWDVASGKELRALAQHKGAVLALAFAPDGKTLLSGGDDKATVRWDVAGQVLETETATYKAAVEAVAFSPDAKLFATGSAEKAHVWKLPQGQHQLVLDDPALPAPRERAHRRPIHGLAFSPDSTKLATGSGDETVKLWEVASGKLLRTFEGHSGRVTAVAFTPDGKKLASGCSDHNVRIWDLAAATDPVTLEHEDSVNGIAFSADGARLAAATLEHTHLWDVAAAKECEKLECESPNVRAVAFAPDGKSLVTASSDGGVRVLAIPAK